MVVVYILYRAEFGQQEHEENAPHFNRVNNTIFFRMDRSEFVQVNKLGLDFDKYVL